MKYIKVCILNIAVTSANSFFNHFAIEIIIKIVVSITSDTNCRKLSFLGLLKRLMKEKRRKKEREEEREKTIQT